ncbi:DUF222 domain-containing protein [Micromonospora sp. WMMD736]|uniref:DUF222 domain-containing protein n=1 Tax=Micromonospora sp. WMMD736 TaxID=3404112 RepID=UPI003B925A55
MDALIDAADALDARLAALPLTGLSVSQLQRLVDHHELRRRRQPAVEHRLLAELQSRTSAIALGAKNWAEVLTRRLRISKAEARRRLDEAQQLGPRSALTGQPLAPQLAALAAAQAAGTVNAEHVRIIRGFFDKLPHWVDATTRHPG